MSACARARAFAVTRPNAFPGPVWALTLGGSEGGHLPNCSVTRALPQSVQSAPTGTAPTGGSRTTAVPLAATEAGSPRAGRRLGTGWARAASTLRPARSLPRLRGGLSGAPSIRALAPLMGGPPRDLITSQGHHSWHSLGSQHLRGVGGGTNIRATADTLLAPSIFFKGLKKEFSRRTELS